MSSFLDRSARQILNQLDDNPTDKNISFECLKQLERSTIILPSRRSALHLKKSFAKIINRPFVAPELITLDQYVKKCTGLNPVDDLTATFTLFEAYSSLVKDAGTFDGFLKWSGQVLSDFNEIDRYLLHPQDVFKNLKDIKEIESWSFNALDLSEGQKKFMEFWDILGSLYENFNFRLKAKGTTTPGQMFREAATRPQSYFSTDGPIFILGFNAISESEKNIFYFLTQKNKDAIFWDIESEFIQNNHFEAGHFARINKNTFPGSFKNISTNKIWQENKSINFFQTQSTINQTHVAANLLQKMSKNELEETALVLCDENLLLPILDGLPDTVETYNITMGYNIKNTISYQLVLLLLEKLIAYERFGSKQNFHHKDFKHVQENPIIAQLYEADDFELLIAEINLYNIHFVDFKLIKKHCPLFYSDIVTLFAAHADVSDFLESLFTALNKIRSGLLKYPTYNIECESLFHLSEGIRKLINLNKSFSFIKQIESVKSLLTSIFSKLNLSFYGEPLNGLQISGLLETRTLSYKNIIVLSANEGYLPQKKFQNSFIPNDLRNFLNLPSQYDKEAIFAYYFYRLLPVTQHIDLIYVSGETSNLDQSETSRYLLQIKEWFRNKKNITFTEHSAQFESTVTPGRSTVNKTVSFFKNLDLLLLKGISPSAINNYLTCKLDFYFKYVLRIQEADKIEETIENNTQGEIIHKVLEILFTDEGNIIGISEIDSMLLKYERITDECYQEKFPYRNYLKGKNLLHYKMAIRSIRNFLIQEKELIKELGPKEILGLETLLQTKLEISTAQGIKTVVLKGKADKIEQQNGEIKIVDYKTGHFDIKATKLTALEKVLKEGKLMQLMFYTYLYYKNHGKIVTSGILSTRNLKAKFLRLETSFELNEKVMIEFENHLIAIIESMYNDEPVKHNILAKYCTNCS